MSFKGRKRPLNPQTAARVRVQQSAPAINTAPSDPKGDRLAYGALFALIIACVAVLFGGAYWSITSILAAVNTTPTNYTGLLFGIVMLVLSGLGARALAWMSVFAGTLIGLRMQGWQSVENICRRSLPVVRTVKVFPGGSIWLSSALSQSLVSRGRYADAIAVAEDEWKLSGSAPGQEQNLGMLCAAAAMAEQSKGETKPALVWNERAITMLTKILEQIENPKKGFMAQVASVQFEKIQGQVKVQLAGSYFNNASIYMSHNDLRKAKDSFKKAVEFAAKSPEFPEKANIIKLGNEQLARLKYN